VPGTVLVVDRAAFLREEIGRLLEAGKWTVVAEADDGRDGLRLAFYHRPALVVTELALPGLPGPEMIRHIKAALPFCRVVVCSALVQSRWVQEAVRAGADDFVVKPVDPERFLRAVGTVEPAGIADPASCATAMEPAGAAEPEDALSGGAS